MPEIDRQHYALQTIFSLFLGLMVVAFIGVGVNTFYPSPADQIQARLDKLFNDQSTLNAGGRTLTAAENAQAKALQIQINDLQTQQQAQEKSWGLNTSIILVILATIVMGVSLVRGEQLRVLSNGLLLGGLFTMLYGMGWTITSGTSSLRFVVVLFALAVTIGLGYVKFVRLRRPAPVASSAGAAGGVPVAEPPAVTMALESRVAGLESTLAAVAAALASEKSAPRTHDGESR